MTGAIKHFHSDAGDGHTKTKPKKKSVGKKSKSAKTAETDAPTVAPMDAPTVEGGA